MWNNLSSLSSPTHSHYYHCGFPGQAWHASLLLLFWLFEINHYLFSYIINPFKKQICWAHPAYMTQEIIRRSTKVCVIIIIMKYIIWYTNLLQLITQIYSFPNKDNKQNIKSMLFQFLKKTFDLCSSPLPNTSHKSIFTTFIPLVV